MNKERLTVMIDPRVRARIDALAKSQRRSTSNMLHILLEDALIALGELTSEDLQ